MYIVSNIFSHQIAHTFLSQTFDFLHFTTHIYPSHYTPLSPLPYAALQYSPCPVRYSKRVLRNTRQKSHVVLYTRFIMIQQ